MISAEITSSAKGNRFRRDPCGSRAQSIRGAERAPKTKSHRPRLRVRCAMDENQCHIDSSRKLGRPAGDRDRPASWHKGQTRPISTWIEKIPWPQLRGLTREEASESLCPSWSLFNSDSDMHKVLEKKLKCKAPKKLGKKAPPEWSFCIRRNSPDAELIVVFGFQSEYLLSV